jgi:hypothetical protein
MYVIENKKIKNHKKNLYSFYTKMKQQKVRV